MRICVLWVRRAYVIVLQLTWLTWSDTMDQNLPIVSLHFSRTKWITKKNDVTLDALNHVLYMLNMNICYYICMFYFWRTCLMWMLWAHAVQIQCHGLNYVWVVRALRYMIYVNVYFMHFTFERSASRLCVCVYSNVVGRLSIFELLGHAFLRRV